MEGAGGGTPPRRPLGPPAGWPAPASPGRWHRRLQGNRGDSQLSACVFTFNVASYGALVIYPVYPPESEFHCAVNEALSREPSLSLSEKRERGLRKGEGNGPREGCHLAAPPLSLTPSPRGNAAAATFICIQTTPLLVKLLATMTRIDIVDTFCFAFFPPQIA